MANRLGWLGLMFVCVACGAKDQGSDVRAADPKVEAILAIAADEAYGEYLSSECSTCHNPASVDTGFPTIDGQDPAYLIQALLEYRDEVRENETMRSIAGALNDEEIAALAAYFSNQ